MNYYDKKGSSWFYSKDEVTSFINDIVNTNSFKSFKYKAILLGKIVAQLNPDEANGILRNASIAVPLKYVSNFWRSLETRLIKYKVELKLKWKKRFVLVALDVNDNADVNSNNTIFTVEDTKLYVPVIKLSAKDNQKLSKLLRKRFGRSVYQNKYKIESKNENTTNEYRYSKIFRS